MTEKKKLVPTVNSLVVSLYKVLGFAILFFILGGLVAYLAGQGFFLVNDSWVAPTIVSASDERVLKLNAELAERLAERDQLLAQKAELEVRIADARRIAASEKTFQERFRVALREDRAARAKERERLAALQKEFDAAADEIAKSNQAYAGLARVRAEALREASLLDREAFLTQNHQLAQLAGTNLGLADRRVTLESQLFSLERQLGALDGSMARIRGGKGGGLSAEVLLLERQYVRSTVEAARADGDVEALAKGLELLDAAISRYDALLAAIDDSPYLAAMQGDLAIAFVPYDNQDSVTPGVALYGCDLAVVWCHRVGRVDRYLDGEVTLRHPARNVILRGRMAVLDLFDQKWVQKDLLHAGRAPLLF
jgi:hypothetical protein